MLGGFDVRLGNHNGFGFGLRAHVLLGWQGFPAVFLRCGIYSMQDLADPTVGSVQESLAIVYPRPASGNLFARFQFHEQLTQLGDERS